MTVEHALFFFFLKTVVNTVEMKCTLYTSNVVWFDVDFQSPMHACLLNFEIVSNLDYNLDVNQTTTGMRLYQVCNINYHIYRQYRVSSMLFLCL